VPFHYVKDWNSHGAVPYAPATANAPGGIQRQDEAGLSCPETASSSDGTEIPAQPSLPEQKAEDQCSESIVDPDMFVVIVENVNEMEGRETPARNETVLHIEVVEYSCGAQ